MRSARTLLATAAASAVLVLGAPGAYAAGGDWDHDDSSYSKEHDDGSKHDEPRGGMHTGGGALTAVNEGDWGGSGDSGEKSWGGGEQEKPHGGMHTGGGGLAQPGATAGGLAVLGVAATGLYAARRRKSAHGAA
ncbi:hypothetical protein ACGF7W_26725 [Streptomyces sp. NPDC048219]|uniref:hypothetical protein n=1 Tax=Streptomyces sp. NPDC048219 TaxID=3365517 RepID=UPI0037210011